MFTSACDFRLGRQYLYEAYKANPKKIKEQAASQLKKIEDLKTHMLNKGSNNGYDFKNHTFVESTNYSLLKGNSRLQAKVVRDNLPLIAHDFAQQCVNNSDRATAIDEFLQYKLLKDSGKQTVEEFVNEGLPDEGKNLLKLFDTIKRGKFKGNNRTGSNNRRGLSQKTVNKILLGVGIALAVATTVAAIAFIIFSSYFIIPFGLLVAMKCLLSVTATTGFACVLASQILERNRKKADEILGRFA